MDGQGFPASSGWQLNSVNLVMANFTERDTHNPPSSASLAVGVPDFYGAVFLVYTQRVTRQVPDEQQALQSMNMKSAL